MHRNRNTRPVAAPLTLLCALALAAVPACGDGGDEPDPSATPVSSKARVKFKGNDRLRNDFARTLDLDPGEVCNELGQYSCTHLVHSVALGGTAAYGQGLYRPLEDSTVTSPMAVDRLAMAACVTRVDRDLAGDGAIIFKNLELDADGALTDVDDEAVATAIDTLYKRAVQRPARASEIEHLRQLYRDILARGGDRPARDWAVLGCFAVMTTLEQLFY